MKEERNIELVRSTFLAFEQGDFHTGTYQNPYFGIQLNPVEAFKK